MTRYIISLCLVLTGMLGYSQINQVNFTGTTSNVTSLPSVESADYFYQEGLIEKQNGRRLESLKNFEKAAKYDANSKPITTELASAYMDLHKYNQARESFKKLVDLGETTPAHYQQLMILSFQLKQN